MNIPEGKVEVVDVAIAVGAIGVLVTAVFAVLIYLLLRSVNLPSVEVKGEQLGFDKPYLFSVTFRLDPPGRPPHAVTEAYVLNPKEARISDRLEESGWGRRVRFNPPVPEDAVFYRTESRGPQILELGFRTQPKARTRPKSRRQAWIRLVGRAADGRQQD